MSSKFIPPEDPNITHIEQSQNEVEPLLTLLPRSAWNSQLNYLRLIFRAKKALDRIEKEAGIFKSYN